nr:retrotransposable element Tf2 [Tanacetum cinerariifolium]
DDLLTQRYVRIQERNIRRSSCELDDGDYGSSDLSVESHPDIGFFHEGVSNTGPFLLVIQTEWQLQQMIWFRNERLTNELKVTSYIGECHYRTPESRDEVRLITRWVLLDSDLLGCWRSLALDASLVRLLARELSQLFTSLRFRRAMKGVDTRLNLSACGFLLVRFSFLALEMVGSSVYSVTSVLTQRDLDLHCAAFNIPAELRPKLPDWDSTIKDSPEGKIGMIDASVCPLSISWFDGTFVVKDPLPVDEAVDLTCVELLNENHTLIRKYPETFLCLLGYSRSFVEMDVRPTLMQNNDEEMRLFDFVKSADPFKVKVGERTLAENDKMVAFVSRSLPTKKARTKGIVISDSRPNTVGKSPSALQRLSRQNKQASTGSRSHVPATEDVTSSFVTPTPQFAHENVSHDNVRAHPASGRFVVLSSESTDADIPISPQVVPLATLDPTGVNAPVAASRGVIGSGYWVIGFIGEAYQLARMQEATNTILKPRYNTPLLPTPKQSTPTTTYASKAMTTLTQTNSVGQNSGYVTRNRKFVPSHKCSGQLHSIKVITEGDLDNYIDGDDETYKDCVSDMVVFTDSPQITLNTLSSLNSYQTMRVRGRVGKKMVHILVDCGSTHNFLDIHTAKKLGCRLDNITPMQVSVANGQRMMGTSVCHDFKRSFQNEVFISDVMLLPLGGCEMVLDIQWDDEASRAFFMALCVYPTQLCQMESVAIISAEVEQVLTQFTKVFEIPKDLPPQRSHDHQIPLMPNTPPINVRPYRYPPNQKDAIEGMVKELMDSVVIKASQSPFSYPIVMVKKKDGTWRMCIDYRQLNKHTIKDKFLIPVIEERIDELNGFVVFFKLDLRSGYHQVRMKEDEICKTAFRTHEGHYEFLVMPFGLTNAPLTFQSLMNTAFKAFLRKFVLVFFDDILIYNKSLKEHSQGVSTDPSKIEAMQKWPIPSTLKQLRGFLGLTSYYRRFIKDYWLPKLLGYDYEIVYKKGSENVVVDALLRVDSSGEFLQIIFSSVSSGVWDKVKDSWENDLDTQNLIKSLENHSYKGNKYSWTGEILKRKGKVVVRNDLELRKELVHHFYDEAIGGHFGAHVTMKKLGSLFYWKCLKKMVKQMIRDCDKEISMDYIEKLPTSYEKSVILAVVDRLSKYAHFIPLTQPFTASQVAQVFLDLVYKLHGLPESIVSDRDKVFLSNFWKALFAELKVKLKLSTAYHPQTDGLTKVVNRSLRCYLRCMCGEKPKEWVKWLPLAEFWYNTNYHTSTKTTPYEAVYCQTPPIHVPYIPRDSRVEKVDRILQAREEAIKVLKFHLKRSQDRMRNQANKHRTDRQFKVGDWVYLKLQPHKQVSIRQGHQNKLSPKYYGPFKVAERIREVAYRLELPNSNQIYLVFHISQLKKCHGKDHSVGVLPQLREDGLLENKPMAILERRLGKVNNKSVMFVLIQWTNKQVEEATWEIYEDLITKFPGFDVVNETVT